MDTALVVVIGVVVFLAVSWLGPRISTLIAYRRTLGNLQWLRAKFDELDLGKIRTSTGAEIDGATIIDHMGHLSTSYMPSSDETPIIISPHTPNSNVQDMTLEELQLFFHVRRVGANAAVNVKRHQATLGKTEYVSIEGDAVLVEP